MTNMAQVQDVANESLLLSYPSEELNATGLLLEFGVIKGHCGKLRKN